MRAAARAAAKAAGEARYRAERPCPKGHEAVRFTSNGTCCVCTEEWKQHRRKTDREPERASARRRRAENLEAARALGRKQRLQNIEKRRASLKLWRQNNPDYEKKRRDACPQAYLRYALRNRFKSALKIGSKSGSAVRDLGCSISDLVAWIESQFAEGMNWENRGKWHIDHKKPLCSFDLTVRERLIEACNWKNLQPLWAFDNLSKGSKL